MELEKLKPLTNSGHWIYLEQWANEQIDVHLNKLLFTKNVEDMYASRAAILAFQQLLKLQDKANEKSHKPY
jgi:quinol monooxygenase YgiN